MKRLIIFALICALCLLSLTACSESAENIPASESEETSVNPVRLYNDALPSEEIEQIVFYNHEDEFILKLFTDRTYYNPGNSIGIGAEFEYIGDEDSVEIFHSSEYLVFTIVNQDGVYYNEGIVNDIGMTSTLEKGITYYHEFKRSGGWNADASDAAYWEDFYSQPELRLPEGTYTIAAHVSFSVAGEDNTSSWKNFNAEKQIVVSRETSIYTLAEEERIKTGDKPFADLSADEILSINIFAIPPNETILVDDAEQIEEIVDILKTVVIYEKSDEWKDSAGQMVTFAINKTTDEKIEVSAYNPHLIIDGQGYKTEYKPCENLNRIANTLLDTRFGGLPIEAETSYFKSAHLAVFHELFSGYTWIEPYIAAIDLSGVTHENAEELKQMFADYLSGRNVTLLWGNFDEMVELGHIIVEDSGFPQYFENGYFFNFGEVDYTDEKLITRASVWYGRLAAGGAMYTAEKFEEGWVVTKTEMEWIS